MKDDTMQKKLKVGIAGYGVVGKRRQFFIDQHPHLQTIAVCDRMFKQSGILKNGIRFYANYEQLFHEDLDILFVCLPNDIAPLVTQAGLQKECHVFCEKPPGRTVQDIQEVIACEKQFPQLKLKYGFNHRYHDSVMDALELIQNKTFGNIISLNGVYGKSKIISFNQKSDWRSQRAIAGGGILLDQGIHMVDLLRLFAGEFIDVHSVVSNSVWHHDVEDNAYALMRTKNNVVALLHSSATQWRHRFNLDINLEGGTIQLGGILTGSKSYGAETLRVAWANDNGAGDPREQITRYNEDNSWKNEIDEFAEAIINNTPIKQGTSEDALKTMQLVFDIYCADPQWKTQWDISN